MDNDQNKIAWHQVLGEYSIDQNISIVNAQ